MEVDEDGHFAISALVIGALVIVGISFLLKGDSYSYKISNFTLEDININGNNPNGIIIVTMDENGFEIENSYAYEIDDQIQILNLIMITDEYLNYGYDRTLNTYLAEWGIHNLAYQLNYKKDHSKSVYFDKKYGDDGHKIWYELYEMFL